MGKNKQQVPRLRFPGFNDAWEQRKLGELYKKNTERNELKFPIEKTISIAKMVFNPEGNGALSESLVNYRVLRVGDIAFEGHKNKDFLFGRFVLNDVGNGIMSPRFSSLRPIEYLNISFWKQYIHYEPIMRGILKNSTKLGTMMNELVIDDFLKQPIDVPTLKEQTAIGDFFRQLDAAIASHQRKLERTNKLKKSLLQKMFPKDGEAFPELRFPDFTDAWEQRKLGECGNTFTGLSGKSKFDFGHGSARYITYVNVLNNPIADKNIVGLVEIDDKQNQVKYGDCFFTTSSETPEEVGMSSVWLENTSNFYLNSFCFGYRPTTSFNPYYLAFMLRSDGFRKKVTFLAQGISRFNISKTKVMDLEIFIPSLKEQTTIGNFFRQLDAAIASHQRKP